MPASTSSVHAGSTQLSLDDLGAIVPMPTPPEAGEMTRQVSLVQSYRGCPGSGDDHATEQPAPRRAFQTGADGGLVPPAEEGLVLIQLLSGPQATNRPALIRERLRAAAVSQPVLYQGLDTGLREIKFVPVVACAGCNASAYATAQPPYQCAGCNPSASRIDSSALLAQLRAEALAINHRDTSTHLRKTAARLCRKRGCLDQAVQGGYGFCQTHRAKKQRRPAGSWPLDQSLTAGVLLALMRTARDRGAQVIWLASLICKRFATAARESDALWLRMLPLAQARAQNTPLLNARLALRPERPDIQAACRLAAPAVACEPGMVGSQAALESMLDAFYTDPLEEDQPTAARAALKQRQDEAEAAAAELDAAAAAPVQLRPRQFNQLETGGWIREDPGYQAALATYNAAVEKDMQARAAVAAAEEHLADTTAEAGRLECGVQAPAEWEMRAGQPDGQPERPIDKPRYWSPTEHQAFVESLVKFGYDGPIDTAALHLAVAEAVGSRSAEQVRTHLQKYRSCRDEWDRKFPPPAEIKPSLARVINELGQTKDKAHQPGEVDASSSA